MIDVIGETVPSIGRDCRLRYVSHIFNLIVNAILYNEESLDFKSDNSDTSDTEASAITLEPRVKVHNSAKYLMRSDQRLRGFIACRQS